jgi:hypothetical protein
MRSQLVFGALLQVPNRYLLCKVAAMALRKLHRPMSRIPETANDVLLLCSGTSPIAETRVPTAAPTRRAPKPEVLASIPASWVGLSEEVRV